MTGPLRLRLPPPGTLSPNNAVDPLRFYYRPLVGRLFTARIDVGLRLLPGRFARLLEVGYGSGLLLPTLATIADALYGVDLEPEPPALRPQLQRIGVQVEALAQADVGALPFRDAYFDGAVAFSILEHLKAPALARALVELGRVLQPGGSLLVGCPAVHRAMNLAFAALGFQGIQDHHFSGIGQILAAAAPHFTLERRACLPSVLAAAPNGWAPYTAVLLRRR